MAVISRRSDRYMPGNCDVDDDVGDCVRITGNQVNDHIQVMRMDPTNLNEDQAVGVIVLKFDATTCLVLTHGTMADVYTGLVPGKRYWVGADSKLTDVRPTPTPGGGAYNLQLMGVATDDEELLLNPQMPIVMRGQ